MQAVRCLGGFSFCRRLSYLAVPCYNSAAGSVRDTFNRWRNIAISHKKILTLVHSFFSSCGGLCFFRMDSPRISSAMSVVNQTVEDAVSDGGIANLLVYSPRFVSCQIRLPN